MDDALESLPSVRTSPGFLPHGHESKAFYPPVAEGILTYCREKQLPVKAEARNLRSSLVSCLNVLFPLRNYPDLACLALAPVLPGLVRVQHFEFLFPEGGASAKYLVNGNNEVPQLPGCQCDAAIWWLDSFGQKRLSLCCWSYTETSYGTCGGFRSRTNPHQDSCLRMSVADSGFPGSCYLSGKVNSWMNWELLTAAGIRLVAAADIAGCPFRGPFYQLLRYYALAAWLRHTENLDLVDVVSVGFEKNTNLNMSPRHLAVLGDDIIQAWNRLLSGVPALRYVCVEEIVAALRHSRCGAADDLLGYLRDRYGLD